MELTIQNSPLTYLKCVLREVRRQEETAETVVPDTYPDIGSILDAHACAVIRGKDCRAGSVIISGGVKGSILYLPEDGSWPRCLEFYMPFSVKVENSELTEQSQVLSSVRVSAADGRMINSRKAMLRVNLSCSITAYEKMEETRYTLTQQPPYLRLRREEYTVDLPLETAERSFLVSDTLELPAGSPPMDRLCKVHCGLELIDQKLVGDKAVFKGIARCKLLYQSEDHRFYVQEFQLPFSQYCELSSEYDGDEQTELIPVMTGYDLEPETPNGATKAYFNLHVLVQCVIFGKQPIEVIRDAFCTKGTLQPTWRDFTLESSLDHPMATQTVHCRVAGDFQQIMDYDIYAGDPSVERTGDTAAITVPLSVHVLGYTQDGMMNAAVGRETAGFEIPLAEQAFCMPRLDRLGNSSASAAPDGADTRVELTICSTCFAGQNIRTLAAGTWEDTAPGGGRSPSVLLRRAGKGSAVWDIAKAAAANEETLRQVNSLEGEWLSEDRVLLIPLG